jgi:hypothetical protein
MLLLLQATIVAGSTSQPNINSWCSCTLDRRTGNIIDSCRKGLGSVVHTQRRSSLPRLVAQAHLRMIADAPRDV